MYAERIIKWKSNDDTEHLDEGTARSHSTSVLLANGLITQSVTTAHNLSDRDDLVKVLDLIQADGWVLTPPPHSPSLKD